MKVLVVDDSPRLAASLKKGLAEEAFAVDVAADGVAGLHMARAGDYDVVLLDLNLPGMDGLSVVRELRRSSSCPDRRLCRRKIALMRAMSSPIENGLVT